jgi:hypothetical protein
MTPEALRLALVVVAEEVVSANDDDLPLVPCSVAEAFPLVRSKSCFCRNF